MARAAKGSKAALRAEHHMLALEIAEHNRRHRRDSRRHRMVGRRRPHHRRWLGHRWPRCRPTAGPPDWCGRPATATLLQMPRPHDFARRA